MGTTNKERTIQERELFGSVHEIQAGDNLPAAGRLVFTLRETSAKESRAWRQRLETEKRGGKILGTSGVQMTGIAASFKRKLRFTVIRASGLAEADASGGSDPFCVLRLGGRAIARTTTVYQSLEPRWGEEGESFIFPIPHPREVSSGRGDLVVEVFDEDLGQASDFLGQVVVSGSALLKLHSVGTYRGADAVKAEVPLQRKPPDEVPLKDQWLVQGTLAYTIEGVDSGDERPSDREAVVNGKDDHGIIGPKKGGEGGGVAISNNSQYRHLEVRIMEAHGLAKADRFGLSDPYVEVYVNGDRKMGRTRTIALTLDPVWSDPEERFVVPVGLDDHTDCELTLDVWDEDDLDQGDFLGQVKMSKSDLLSLRLPTGPMEYELEPKDGKSKAFNALVQGVINFSIRELGGEMPNEPESGKEGVTTTCAHDPEVAVTVISASNLARADVFGSSDPFAVVSLNGREVGRTRTLYKTLEPVWSDPSENFPLPMVGDKRRCRVTVELWDEDLGKRGDFLGQAMLGPDEINLPEGELRRELQLELKPRPGVPLTSQHLVQGTLRLAMEAVAPKSTLGDGASRSYTVTVDRAWGLAKADRFGKSDPFVVIKTNGDGVDAERGRTRTIPNTLEPVWHEPPEIFIVTDVEEILVEVWDADRLRRGDFLGRGHLTKLELAEAVPVDGTHEFDLALHRMPEKSEKFNRLVQGYIRISCTDWMSPRRMVDEGLGTNLNVSVISATDLPRHQQFNHVSPYAVLKWNRLEIGRTAVASKTSSPLWDETFNVRISGHHNNGKEALTGMLAGENRTPEEVEVVIEVCFFAHTSCLTLQTTRDIIRDRALGQVVLHGIRELHLQQGIPGKVLQLPLRHPLEEPDPSVYLKDGTGGASYNPHAELGVVTLYLESVVTTPNVVPGNSSEAVVTPVARTPLKEDVVAQDETGPHVSITRHFGDRAEEVAAPGMGSSSAGVNTSGGEGAEEETDGVGTIDETSNMVRFKGVSGPRAGDSVEGGKFELSVLRARGLVKAARVLDCAVSLLRNGRSLGKTRVADLGGTSPQWFNERFIISGGRFVELTMDVLGRRRESKHALEFLGQVTMGLMPKDILELADSEEPEERRLTRKPYEIMPSNKQELVGGSLTFTLRRWHEFNYAEEMKRSQMTLGLQVQIRVVSTGNLANHILEVFATVTFRDVEIGKTPFATAIKAPVSDDSQTREAGTPAAADEEWRGTHRWEHVPETLFNIPLPEESADRAGVAVGVDLWARGRKGKERGDHLGQVLLSGDFVPHIVHGAIVPYPLRPGRGGMARGNLEARGSLFLQLMVRRGGEGLASEALEGVVALEVLAAKGIMAMEGYGRSMFCVVKADKRELGRTRPTNAVPMARNRGEARDPTGLSKPSISVPERVELSWEDQELVFPVSLIPEAGGGLPDRVSVEVWCQSSTAGGWADGAANVLKGVAMSTSSRDRAMTGGAETDILKKGEGWGVHLVGEASLGPDELIWAGTGRVSFPLAPPKEDQHVRSAEAGMVVKGETTSNAAVTPVPRLGTEPSIVLRVTPRVGSRWAARAVGAAARARPFVCPDTIEADQVMPRGSQGERSGQGIRDTPKDSADVLFMTSAEGTARDWRMPVTPGNSVAGPIFRDAVELVCSSQSALCPSGPSLAVAPFSDVGVRLGGSWVGPEVGHRHAIVAHRPTEPSGGLSPASSSAAQAPTLTPPAEDELFLRSVAAEVECLLRGVRAREMRCVQRELALKRMALICSEWSENRSQSRLKRGGAITGTELDGKSIDGNGDNMMKTENVERCGVEVDEEEDFEGDEEEEEGGMTGFWVSRAYDDLYRRFISAIESFLPGVSIYLGLVQRGGKSIRYVACNRNSSMVGKELVKGEGMSFSCVGPSFLPYAIFPPRKVKAGIGHEPLVTTNYRSYPVMSAGKSYQSKEVTRQRAPSQVGMVNSKESAASAPEDKLISSIPFEEGTRIAPPLSQEEGALMLQKVIRGKIDRDQAQHLREAIRRGVKKAAAVALVRRAKMRRKAKQAPLVQTPKIFDYDGRVGWPFVCAPLVASLGCSSIGVLGLDTFDHTGGWEDSEGRPEAGMVNAVVEAARLLGKTIDTDRKQSALARVLSSSLDYSSTLSDVLEAAVKALTLALAASSKAEVWRINPSSGNLYIMVKRSVPVFPRESNQLAERDTLRFLKVEVVSAELSAAYPGGYLKFTSADAFSSLSATSVSVSVSAGAGVAYRTKPSQELIAPTWNEGPRRLRLDPGVACIRVEVNGNSKVSRNGETGVSTAAEAYDGSCKVGDERGSIVAVGSVDLPIARDGFVYIPLFSTRGGRRSECRAGTEPWEGNPTTEKGTSEVEEAVGGVGQLVLRLERLDRVEEQAKGVTLLLHGARALAKADFLGKSDPYCVVKWRDMELGRSKTCPRTLDPDWGGEAFHLAFPEDPADTNLIVEVWDEDAGGARRGDFLGQVSLSAPEILALLTSACRRELPVVRKPSAELRPSKQKLVQGYLDMSFERVTTVEPVMLPMETVGKEFTTANRPTSPVPANSNIVAIGEVAVTAGAIGGFEGCGDEGGLAESRPRTVGLEVVVMGATGLPKADRWGKSDPYVVVIAQGREAGRTRVVSKTLDPVWSNPEERFDVEVWEGIPKGEKEEGYGLAVSSSQLLESFRAGVTTNSSTLVEAFEENTGVSERDGTEEERVAAKGGALLLCVRSAVGLRNADVLGQSDPYCVVKLGAKEVGRTRTLHNTLNPVWEKPEERFTVLIDHIFERPPPVSSTVSGVDQPSYGIQEDGNAWRVDAELPSVPPSTNCFEQGLPLTVELWDKDFMHGNGDWLGSATIPADMILHPPGDLILTLSSRQQPQPGDLTPAPTSTGRAEDNVQVDVGDKGRSKGTTMPGGRGVIKWGSSLLHKGLRGVTAGGWLSRDRGAPGEDQEVGWETTTSSSVHLWIGRGKTEREAWGGWEPGTGRATLRVHRANGLRKADRFGKSDPMCVIYWNGSEAGTTSTIRKTLDPEWNPDKEVFLLTMPRDKALCELHVDIWDMDYGGALRGDFLGRVHIPTAQVLHPPAGGRETTITLPLHPLEGVNPAGNNVQGGRGEVRAVEHGEEAPSLVENSLSGPSAATLSLSAGNGSNAHPETLGVLQAVKTLGGDVSGAAGKLAGRMLGNIMHGVWTEETAGVTGTLTLSLELDAGWQQEEQEDDVGVGEDKKPPHKAEKRLEYTKHRFKVAEDIGEETRRREKEGILVPGLLSRVQALHDKLRGDIATGVSATKLVDLTDGAAGVIPEVLAGQVLSLVRRNGTHTVLSGGGVWNDRLLVLLDPTVGSEEQDGTRVGGRACSIEGRGQGEGQRYQERWVNRGKPKGKPTGGLDGIGVSRVRVQEVSEAAEDVGERCGLVVSCAPGQISKEDVVLAGEVARHVERAAAKVDVRRRRRETLNSCVEQVQVLCEECDAAFFSGPLDAMESFLSGAGPELDCHARDIGCVISTLIPGGRRLETVASSGWDGPDAPLGVQDRGQDGDGCSLQLNHESSHCPRTPALSMSCGLICRAVEMGEIFLVAGGSICMGSATWTEIPQESMPHQRISSDPALEASVSALQHCLGGTTESFMIAPLWVRRHGSIGVIVLTDVPFVASGKANTRKQLRQARSRGMRRETAAEPKMGLDCRPFIMEPGLADLGRSVGIAIADAAHRARTKTLLAAIEAPPAPTEGLLLPAGVAGAGIKPEGGPKLVAGAAVEAQAGDKKTRKEAADGWSSDPCSPGGSRLTSVLVELWKQSIKCLGVNTCKHRSESNQYAPSILPLNHQAICHVYCSARAAVAEGLPWVCGVNIWHVSSIPEDELAFPPPSPPRPCTTTCPSPSDSGPNSAAGLGGSSAGKGDPLEEGSTGEPDGSVRRGQKVVFCRDNAAAAAPSDPGFREHVTGRTWSGTPRVVLRSLWSPEQCEVCRAAQWLKEEWTGVFAGDIDWTDSRLRLLADEWELCASGGDCVKGHKKAGGDANTGGRIDGEKSAIEGAATGGGGQKGEGAGEGEEVKESGCEGSDEGCGGERLDAFCPPPFVVHTGHLIVPFHDRHTRDNTSVVGHGLALMVDSDRFVNGTEDRGVEKWKPWEGFLKDIACAASR
ncbi:unnamed protein product, partial [Discosporangium mesarthrocarpum]